MAAGRHLAFFVLHRGAQDRVDPGLVAWAAPEMLQYIAVEPDADLFLRPRHDERRRGEPIRIEFWCNIRVVPD